MINRRERKLKLYEKQVEESVIAFEDGFYLCCKKLAEGNYEFWIEDDMGILYDIWELDTKDIDTAVDHFYNFLDEEDKKTYAEYDDDYYDYYDDYLKYRDDEPSDWLSRYSSTNYPVYKYEPPKKRTGFYDEYTKSDTLVFHKTDHSTDMLSQIYEGKNWDVIRSTYDLDQEELFKVVDAHDRIVCLGHGSSYGLIGMFGPEMAPHFKDKKLFIIWCNADGYFNKYDLGKGQFVTGNMPSEVWECSGAGCGKISKELMLENITYWSKLCADVTERCLKGDVKSSVDYIRKNYLEKYGNHPVTIYNSNRTQCLGEPQPLPKYQFKGKPLGDADKPVPNFNEEEFLKNPVENIRDLPNVELEPEEKPFGLLPNKEDKAGGDDDANN